MRSKKADLDTPLALRIQRQRIRTGSVGPLFRCHLFNTCEQIET